MIQESDTSCEHSIKFDATNEFDFAIKIELSCFAADEYPMFTETYNEIDREIREEAVNPGEFAKTADAVGDARLINPDESKNVFDPPSGRLTE
jgi:hypothetical protein